MGTIHVGALEEGETIVQGQNHHPALCPSFLGVVFIELAYSAKMMSSLFLAPAVTSFDLRTHTRAHTHKMHT